ncbi:MAG TPA: hypothetical protein PLP14_00255 [Chitinophagaceae bacterium]|nr:hypothetical protein [Chitinophagaceae bacterium]
MKSFPALYSALLLCLKSITIGHSLSTDTLLKRTDTLSAEQILLAKHKAEEQQQSWRTMSNYFRLDFFSTLNARYNTPGEMAQSELNQAGWYYQFRCINQFRTTYFSVHINVFNELGYRYYFDSLLQKNEDQFQFRTDLLGMGYKNLQLSISYQLKTQLWNAWQYTTSNQRSLYTAFLSPGYSSYTAGIQWRLAGRAQIEWGLISLERTAIRRKKIFETRNEEILYGVQAANKSFTSWGMSIACAFPPLKLNRFFYWENNSRLFFQSKGVGFSEKFSMDIQNGVHFLFLRYLRLGLSTGIRYNDKQGKEVQMRNTILFGFYLSNKM